MSEGAERPQKEIILIIKKVVDKRKWQLAVVVIIWAIHKEEREREINRIRASITRPVGYSLLLLLLLHHRSFFSASLSL